MSSIRKYKHDNFICLTLENKNLLVEFLPEIGGKMIHLYDKVNGREWLLGPQSKDRKYRSANYGDSFETYDTSGFDECFPTIEKSYSLPTSNATNHLLEFPDHGELWSRGWDYEIGDDQIKLSISGVGVSYIFSKNIFLEDNRIIIEYTLENRSSSSFKYIWSAHPLLSISPGSKIIIPQNVNKVFLNWSSDNAMGKFGDMISWPHLKLNGINIDLSLVPDKKFGAAIKCFTDLLTEGLAAVFDERMNHSIAFRFDVKEISHIGIWLCYGGWPTTSDAKHFTIGLEPCKGRPDSLQRSIESGECAVIGAQETQKWSLDISVWTGLPKK